MKDFIKDSDILSITSIVVFLFIIILLICAIFGIILDTLIKITALVAFIISLIMLIKSFKI